MENLSNKLEGKMIMAKMVADRKLQDFVCRKKSGSHWTDLGIAVIVGLVLAGIFKDKISEVLKSIGDKVTTQVGTW